MPPEDPEGEQEKGRREVTTDHAQPDALKLTDSQVDELHEMAPAQAKLLRMWREATQGPWRMMGHMFVDVIGDVPMSKMLIEMVRTDCNSDREAIVYARNSAELNAAWVYWEMEYSRMECAFAEHGDRASEMVGVTHDEFDVSKAKLHAVAAALEEIA